jgi:hypothetical protein
MTGEVKDVADAANEALISALNCPPKGGITRHRRREDLL